MEALTLEKGSFCELYYSHGAHYTASKIHQLCLVNSPVPSVSKFIDTIQYLPLSHALFRDVELKSHSTKSIVLKV